ncbi:MAG: pantoate--beta-alanine ligase [Candidatus Eisenbacteria bacterium]|nr:pantoate--beta-alanine ligase [Candidatus Eisenbacteria bacterium]
MQRVRHAADVRRAVADLKRRGARVAFVPTMGAIHEGHVSLVARARAGGARVVASIFVNPLQFGPREDYRHYPRPVRRDRARLAAAGVDLLWEPPAGDLYPAGHRTRVRVTELGDALEGASRPGHFEGVATVVLQLLLVVMPDELWLGQKDAQQARIIERMVRDLGLTVRVRRGATVRAADGLALSSRNAYLDAAERRDATALARGLAAARAAMAGGERSAARVRAAVRRVWRRFPRVREDYVAVVDADTLAPLARIRGRVLVAVAARVGRARLIDNLEWRAR